MGISMQNLKDLPITVTRPLLAGVNSNIQSLIGYGSANSTDGPTLPTPTTGPTGAFLSMEIEPVMGMPVAVAMASQVNVNPTRTACFYKMVYDGYMLPLFTTTAEGKLGEEDANTLETIYSDARGMMMDSFTIFFSCSCVALVLMCLCTCGATAAH